VWISQVVNGLGKLLGIQYGLMSENRHELIYLLFSRSLLGSNEFLSLL